MGRARSLCVIGFVALLGISAALAQAASMLSEWTDARQAGTVIGLSQNRPVSVGGTAASQPRAPIAVDTTDAFPVLLARMTAPEPVAADDEPPPVPTQPPPPAEEQPPPPPAEAPFPAPEQPPPVIEEPPTPKPEPPPVPEPEPEPPPAPEPEPEAPGEPEPPAPPPDPVPPPSPDLAVGIDGHYAGWPQAEIQDRTALAAPVTRHLWDLGNPVSAEEQQMIAAATKIHTRVHALLGGNEIGDATHYRDFVVEFVRYWGPGGTFWGSHPELDESSYAIRSIELGNEPYFGPMTAAEYADAVRPALEAVAQLGVPVKVILPSFIHGQDTSWIDTLYARIPNLNSLFHAFADHPYWYGHDPAAPGSNGPFARIDELRTRMDEHGATSKPIYITEYGESTASCGGECVTEAVQAEHLRSMLDEVLDRPDWKVEMLLFFQLRDRGTESPDREEQFGLLRQNGTPKPAYPIVREAMQRYRG